jgi:hypothetical protein
MRVMPLRWRPWSSPRRTFLLLLALASGAASLAYQIVWMRRLVLVFGSASLATSTVLVVFLGGLALGAWVWGRAADRHTTWALSIYGAGRSRDRALRARQSLGIQGDRASLSHSLSGA